MATIFQTRLIGNIGKDATLNKMDRGVMAINFPVAHNKNWKDKKSGEMKTKTTWVNCTIWKKEGANLRILDYLKKGALVDLEGTPFAKAFKNDDGSLRSEIRLNVTKTNVLRAAKCEDLDREDVVDSEEMDSYFDAGYDEYTLNEEDF